DRAKLIATVPVAMEAAEQIAANAMQGGLFDALPDAGGPMADYAKVRPWGERERLKEEKTAIGFFLSGHPFNSFKSEVRRFVRRPLSQVEPSRDLVTMAGVVMDVRMKMTARGKMAFVVLDDGTAVREISVFNELYESRRGKIVVDEILIVDGKVSNDDFTGGYRIIADSLMTLAEARGRFAQRLEISLNGEVGEAGSASAAAQRLENLLAPYRDESCPVLVRYRNADAEGDLPLGAGWRVRLEDSLLDSLREWLPAEAVEVRYR
ncbi:MAG: DNA polymerase III subunit alpha, partial [Rhodocyclaceae bacterium]|nr:DNA polymerase III subunit alpha [Rhodocyclaceae bacterium]